MDRNRIVRFFLPQKCMFCGDIITEGFVCRECADKTEMLKIPEFAREIKHSCFKSLDRCISFYYYKDSVRDAVIRAKFKSCGSFIDGFMHCIPVNMAEFCAENNIAVITSMPAHRSKFYSREYDLPMEMVRRIAKSENLEYNVGLIKKVRKTENQHDLPLSKRKSNLKGAFELSAEVKGKRILLVDDIVSTGYSLEEAAKCLKKGGAAQVTAITFAYNKL